MEEGKRETSPASMEIRFSNVDFAYEKKKILNHVSFTIPEKKMTAIVGPSGSGKTTLCRLIPRFCRNGFHRRRRCEGLHYEQPDEKYQYGFSECISFC